MMLFLMSLVLAVLILAILPFVLGGIVFCALWLAITAFTPWLMFCDWVDKRGVRG